MLRFWLIIALVAVALGDQKQEPSGQRIEGNYGLGDYGLGDYGLGELVRGEYGRRELDRGEYGRGEYDRKERCCGGRDEYGQNRNLKRILEDYALVPWVEPLKGVRSHAPAPIVAIQNKIVRENFSPDYIQPVKVIDYRYLKTGREYTRGPGGQVIILPTGVKDPRYGSYDALIESLKHQRLREREGRYHQEQRSYQHRRYEDRKREEEYEGYGERIPVYNEGQERLIQESVRARRPELVDEPVLRKNQQRVGK